MRVAKDQRRSGTTPTANSRNIPAPFKGLNTVDALAAMDERYALRLDNWYPRATYVEVRAGSLGWASGLLDDVESILPYNPPDGGNEMFAASGNTRIYDTTASGAVGAAVVTGLTNSRWQSVNYAAASGTHYLICVNGADNMLYYDGAAWTPITGVSVPAVTGVATNTFIHVNVFKQRLFFIPIDKLSFWYLPVTAVGGAATEFLLSSYFRRGGYLMAMATWTVDAGNGSDDLAVFWSSEGEVAVFRGSDPGDPTDWSLIGVYFIGRPIGRRCFAKWGGDMLALTQSGVFPLSKALLSSTLNREEALSYKIDPTFRELYQLYGSQFGWDITVFPAQTMLIVNVPSSPRCQLVFNYETRAWCRFTGWDAFCFAEFNGRLWFGASGRVWEAWEGQYDRTESSANVILAEAKSAFSYLNNRRNIKDIGGVRPYLGVDASIDFLLGLNVNYEDIPPTGTISYAAGSTSLWDVGVWDSSVWSSDQEIQSQWVSPAVRPGICVAVLLTVYKRRVDIQWISSDIMWTDGGLFR